MATTTTLGFSILSRYSGHGVTQARRDLAALRAQMATINGDLQRHTNLLGGIPNRWKMVGAAVASVLPALIPLSAAALQTAGAFTTMSVAVGAAVGAYVAALKGAISKTMEMAKAGKALSPVQKEFVSSVNGMKSAWAQFISSTQNKTLATATNVVQGLTSGIKLLKPLVDAIHPSLLQISKDFEAWTKGDSARNYSNLLSAIAKTVMPSLSQAGKDVLNVLGDGFRAFAPLTKGMAESIAAGAAALKSWSDGGGFQRFLTYVRDNAPAVQAFWKAFREALANVFNTLHQFSGGVLHVLTDSLRAIAAINPESVKAFANAMLLLRAPILFLVLNCPPLRDAMIALLGAMNPTIIYAVAAAFIALRIAFMIMNTALLTTPLGWIIMGLVALGVAIAIIATKTTWFQTAWTYTWNFIKTVFSTVYTFLTTGLGQLVLLILGPVGALLILLNNWSTVWNAIKAFGSMIWQALQTAWHATINAIVTAWNAVAGALSAAWNAVWNALKTAAQFVWTALQLAWSLFITGLQAIWTAVSGALSTAWNAVWNAIKTAAQFVWTSLQLAWSLFITGLQAIWSTVSGALSAAWNAVWNVIKGAAMAVWAFLQTAWHNFIVGVQVIWSTVSSALSSAWNTVWNAIKGAAMAVWAFLQTAWNTFLTAVRTAYNTFASAVTGSWNLFWNAIKTAAQTVWNWLKTAWQALVDAVRTVYNTFASALKGSWDLFWNAIKNAAKAVWDWIKEKWEQLCTGVRVIYNDFSQKLQDSWDLLWKTLKDGAHKWWELIKKVIADAINWLLKPINLLIKGFNNIASALNMDISIPEIKVEFANGGMVGGVPHFAAGGVANFSNGGAVPGYAPGRDTVPAVLSRGEGVLVPEAVRGLGGANFVHGANHYFSKGRAPRRGSRWSPGGRGCGPQGFADGGMVGGVQHFAVGGMTAAALAKAGVSLGMVSQGEYSDGSLSGGTHLGGGAVDISSTSPAVLAALKAAGFAAWIRGPAEGMSPHIHAVLMGHPELSAAAQAQVASFLAGGSGLGVGGGGGGGFSPIDFIKNMFGASVGEILRKIAKFGGSLADYMTGGGGGDDDGGGGGIFDSVVGTIADIANPFNDDNPVADKAAEVAGGAMSGIVGMFLAAIDRSAVEMAFDWIGFDDSPAGMMGDMMAEMGSQSIEGAIDWVTNKAEEMAPDMSAMMGGGDVSTWAPLAAMALAMAGISANQLPAFLALMAAESGGNPLAVNNWDSNAAMGQASQGLMQVIPSTFAAYRDPSLPNNILDPLANMVASARYIRAVYGGLVPGSPYANGTPGATRGVHLVGEQGPELMNFAGGETVTPAKETAGIMGGGAGGALPEDMMDRFKLLMTLSQQMATTVQTSWGTVQASGRTAQSALAPVFSDIATQIGTDIPTAMATMSAANTACWAAMQTGTTTAWTAMRDGTFLEANDHMAVKMPQWGGEMCAAVSEAWVNMGDATATAWEAMKEGTRGPTNWIIENSYNDGIARLWNEVAAVIFEDGARTLPSVATLAKGGPVHGPGGERSDRVPAMLSRGEHVWTAREVHRAGGHHAVQAMRSGVMGGRDVRGASRGCAFALGGWSDPGGLGLPSLGELKRGSMMDEAEPFLDALDSGVKASLATSPYRRMGGSAGALSPSDWMRQYIKKDDELNKLGSGGPPWIPGVSDAITSWGGVTVNQRTADMLNMAIALGASFSATQGSFSTGVAASAGTHDGGGVVDLVPTGDGNVGALRAVGFAAWNRGAAYGSPSFSDHIHAVALGDPTVSPGAAAQVMSYLAGGNGLADGGPDNFSGGIPGGASGVLPAGGGREVDPADLEQRTVSFDRGGLLQPGYTLAYNGTGKPEPVGHNLEPRGSRGDVHIEMPITISGNTDAQAVVDGINNQVLPKLRQYLNQGTGTNC